MVNETPRQNVAVAEVTVLRAVCDPSLKVSFMNRLAASGFRTQTDAILTLARDFVAGRIQYRDGIVQSQQKNQSVSVDGVEGVPLAPES